jgi:hypothetical protein
MAQERKIDERVRHFGVTRSEYWRGTEKRNSLHNPQSGDLKVHKGDYFSERLRAEPTDPVPSNDWTTEQSAASRDPKASGQGRTACNISVDVLGKEMDAAVPALGACDLALGTSPVAAVFRQTRLNNHDPKVRHFDWNCSLRIVHARQTCIVAAGR